MRMKGTPMPATRRAPARKTVGRVAATRKKLGRVAATVPARLERLRDEAFARVLAARRAVLARAEEAASGTRQAVSRVERVFEQRVSRAIAVLGVPRARDVRALSRQVAELQQNVEKLRRSRARA